MSPLCVLRHIPFPLCTLREHLKFLTLGFPKFLIHTLNDKTPQPETIAGKTSFEDVRFVWYTFRVLHIVYRVFPQLPDLTFLSFLYKIDITGFQNQQKKITSTGYWTHNTNPTLRFPAPLTTQPPRHLLNRRFIKLNFDHFRFNRAWL